MWTIVSYVLVVVVVFSAALFRSNQSSKKSAIHIQVIPGFLIALTILLSLGSIHRFNNPKVSSSSPCGVRVPVMRHLFLFLVTGSAITALLFYGTNLASVARTNTHCPSRVKRRDVLIGFAVNYNVAQIYPTLHAFHEMTGPQQDIVLFVTLPNQIKVSSMGRLLCVTCILQ